MQKTIQMNSFYSLLNASTGSCFAAFLDGIIPPINVKIVLNTIKIIPANKKIILLNDTKSIISIS